MTVIGFGVGDQLFPLVPKVAGRASVGKKMIVVPKLVPILPVRQNPGGAKGPHGKKSAIACDPDPIDSPAVPGHSAQPGYVSDDPKAHPTPGH